MTDDELEAMAMGEESMMDSMSRMAEATLVAMEKEERRALQSQQRALKRQQKARAALPTAWEQLLNDSF